MNDAKRTILARRARFVAAALASLGCGKTTAAPPDAEPALVVLSCLSAASPMPSPPPPAEEADAAPPASLDAGVPADAAPTDAARPRGKVPPRATAGPRPCLTCIGDDEHDCALPFTLEPPKP